MSKPRPFKPPRAVAESLAAACEFCGDQGPLLLKARCHLTAPLQVILEGNVLIVRCYIPECLKEVARFEVKRQIS